MRSIDRTSSSSSDDPRGKQDALRIVSAWGSDNAPIELVPKLQLGNALPAKLQLGPRCENRARSPDRSSHARYFDSPFFSSFSSFFSTFFSFSRFPVISNSRVWPPKSDAPFPLNLSPSIFSV